MWEVLIVSSDTAADPWWRLGKNPRGGGGRQTKNGLWNELKWFRRMEKERVKPDGERGTHWPERIPKSFSLAGLQQLWNITGTWYLLFVAHTSSMPHVSCCPFSDPKKGCQPPSSSSSESVI